MKNIVWTKNECIYCSMAKDFLKSKQIKFEERNISTDWNKSQLLADLPNVKTLPQIILYDKHIGGYTELLKYSEDHGMWTNE